jgi:hypothetical protein
MIRRWLALGVLGIGLTMGVVSPVSACPSCKEAIGADPSDDAQRLANGYSRSILLMMGMPIALAGVGALMVVRAARQGRLPEL